MQREDAFFKALDNARSAKMDNRQPVLMDAAGAAILPLSRADWRRIRVRAMTIACVLLAGGCQSAPERSPVPAKDTPAAPAGVRSEPRVLLAYVWNCDDGSALTTRYLPARNALVIRLGTGTRTLLPVRSASGAKYEDESMLFWDRGVHVTLQRKPGSPVSCREVRSKSLVEDARARGVTFRALGNEPGAVLEIGPDRRVDFDYRDEQLRVAFSSPAPQEDFAGAAGDEGRSGANAIEVTLREQRCMDDMSGERFPVTLVLQVNAEIRRGCGLPLDQ